MSIQQTYPKRPLRLAIFSQFFGPGAGGAEMQVLSLATGIVKQNRNDCAHQFEVTVVSGVNDEKGQDCAHPFTVIRQPSLLQTWRLIAHADVVHLAGPVLEPLLMAVIQRKPTVIEHHGYQSICPNGILVHQPERSVCAGYFQAKKYTECVKCQAHQMPLLKSIFTVFLTVLRNMLSKAVAANVAITDHVLKRHALPSSERIYYGTADESSGDHPGEIANLPLQKACIGYVGRFVPEKGIPVLLDAAALLKSEGLDFTVRLVGDGPQRHEIENLIAARSLRDCVTITGYVSGMDMQRAMQGVTAVAIPSVWEEAAGLVALEQMMAGRPVIASAIGGLKEVVGDGGVLFPPGDAVALAAIIRRMVNNPGLRESVSGNARNRALRLFQIDRMVEDHIRLYLRLAGSTTNQMNSPSRV